VEHHYTFGMKIYRKSALRVALLLGVVTAGCSKKHQEATQRQAPPATASVAPNSAEAKAFAIAQSGKASFLIDAPLEKIRGEASGFRGSLRIDPENLSRSRGEIEVDLATLTTDTFDDKDKNARQTEHAHNWLGLGSDAPDQERRENQWVRFTIGSLTAVPAKLADAPVNNGRRRIKAQVSGMLWLHGVAVPKAVEAEVSFGGPAEAPTDLEVSTISPLLISLRQHDVKPRDLAGKFLQGALEKIGDKIVDQVKVSFELRAKPAGK